MPKKNLTPQEELDLRKKWLLDQYRPKATLNRHNKGKKMIRELIEIIVSGAEISEYGGLIIAAQRGRRSLDDLIKNTPADGLVCLQTSVSYELDQDMNKRYPIAILGYDYTVLAGTQGAMNHKKTDRMLSLVKRKRIPVIFFLEGGGGRPGDVDFYPISVGGLDLSTFVHYAALDGVVPRIGIVTGYCFAGNAALAGCSDILIATADSSIGMGGPAMIEGGGLGAVHADDIGPAQIMCSNGTIHILVNDDISASQMAKKCLGYLLPTHFEWSCQDQNLLNSCLPEDRRYAYDIKKVIDILCDIESVLYLKSDYGKTIITAFVRIEGKTFGLVANNCKFLGGAIDATGAQKMAQFLDLCQKFELPVISLCDTPGFMVGTDAESSGMVSSASRLFTSGAKLTVPHVCIILRKAYGLGAMAMAGGSMHSPLATLAWPTGEFGAMGLEGAVKLSHKKELDACDKPEDREALYQELLTQLYDQGKALNAASVLEIDDVVLPSATRQWICEVMRSRH